MKRLLCSWVLFLLVLVIFAGCQSGSDSKSKVYDIKGKVVAVDAAKKSVTLDHEDIPGFMKAMEMKFSAEKSTMLEGIKAGDQVQGKLKVTGNDYVITELQKR